jgi:hypothetical protein
MRLVPVFTLVVLLLVACGESLSVEQKIIETLQTMELTAEAGEHFKFMGHITDSFQAQQGSMDRRGFHRFMIFQINQNRRLQATFFPIYVRESGENMASAHFRLLVTGGGGLLPENGQFFEVETQWLLQGGDWMLDEANWEIAQLPDLPSPRNPNR